MFLLTQIIFYSSDNAKSPKIHVIHILLAVPPWRQKTLHVEGYNQIKLSRAAEHILLVSYTSHTEKSKNKDVLPDRNEDLSEHKTSQIRHSKSILRLFFFLEAE